MTQVQQYFMIRITLLLLFSSLINNESKGQGRERLARYITLSYDHVYNLHKETFNKISLGYFAKGITSHIAPTWPAIVYSQETEFTPRTSKSNFEIYFRGMGGIPFSRVHKQNLFYFNLGLYAGLKKIQKEVSSKVSNPASREDYDIRYQYKLFLGMPLGLTYMYSGKKKNAFGIHTHILLKKNMEFTAGLDLYLGKIK